MKLVAAFRLEANRIQIRFPHISNSILQNQQGSKWNVALFRMGHIVDPFDRLLDSCVSVQASPGVVQPVVCVCVCEWQHLL